MKVSDIAVRANKKQADFRWREWVEHAERTQELYSRVSQSQDHAVITLGDGKSPVLLLPFSDQHIGGRGVTYREFRKLTEEILETKNLYVALLGDPLEFAVKLRSVAEVCAQIFGPDKQMQFVEDWFGEIKHKVCFATWCNHVVEREEKFVGFSFLKHLMAKDVVFFDGIGEPDVVVGKQTYKLVVSHKFRGYSYHNPTHAGSRHMRFEATDREIAMMGDKHTPAFQQYYDGKTARLSLVAGTLNVNSIYAKRYFSLYTHPQYPVIELRHDRHEFVPFRNLATWRLYARSLDRLRG